MPTPEQIEKAKELIRKKGANYQYFFEKLNSPSWIKPLWESGLFRDPPKVSSDGETLSIPPWPESQYLARMTSIDPTNVLDILLKIPGTDNFRVHIDYIDASCNMPPDLAARWVNKEINWIKKQKYLYLLLPVKYSNLITHLLKGGQIDSALKLFKCLLHVVNGPFKHQEDKIRQEPHGRFELWEYQNILKEHIPTFVDLAGYKLLNILCGLLSASVYSLQKEGEVPEDSSYAWRPAIEDHSQNHDHGTHLRSTLVTAVRDAAVRMAKNDITQIKEIINLLETKPWPIFHRIALYLMREFSDTVPELVVAKLTDRALFDSFNYRHEYFRLSNSCFSKISLEDQELILSWIEKGLEREQVRNILKEHFAETDIEEGITKYIDAWRRDRLAPFVDSLSSKWRKRYDEIVDRCGMPHHPDFLFYTEGGWVGPTSPVNAEELRAYSIEQIVDYIREWKPQFGWMSPSPEGLGRAFSSIVVADPEKYAASALAFQNLDPTYVNALLSGFRDSISQDREIKSWEPVLKLCKWTLSQPREIPGRGSIYLEIDPGWTWTRKTITDMLTRGLMTGPSEIPISLRSLVWEVLYPLTQDPEPTPEYEETYDGSNMDPATLSINTIRGAAMHAVIVYALWIKRYLKTDKIPEVIGVLDLHLDPNVDPSLAIRTVYGHYYPQLLVHLDRQWAETAIPRIFPEEAGMQDLRDSAWVTYITFNDPYHEVFSILKDEYIKAIKRLNTALEFKDHFKDPGVRLAEHLMILYWTGQISLGEEENLLDLFFENAQDKLAAYAIEFIGISLSNIQETISLSVLQRITHFWEWRSLQIIKKGVTKHNHELAAFGWWFISKKFDDLWSIDHLKKVLVINAGKIDFEHEVVKQLAKLMPKMPREVLECLSIIVKCNKTAWQIYHWKDDAIFILNSALKIEDLNEEARAIIDHLCPEFDSA